MKKIRIKAIKVVGDTILRMLTTPMSKALPDVKLIQYVWGMDEQVIIGS